MKTIAVDFDGVIHKFSEGWKDGTIYDEVIEGATKEINYLKKKGYDVICFTTRENIDVVKSWLWEREIKIDVTNKKPKAIVYIDDRAIRFTNWNDIAKYF